MSSDNYSINTLKVFTITEASKVLGIDRSKVRYLVDKGRLITIEITPGMRRIPYKSICRWQERAIEDEVALVSNL